MGFERLLSKNWFRSTLGQPNKGDFPEQKRPSKPFLNAQMELWENFSAKGHISVCGGLALFYDRPSLIVYDIRIVERLFDMFKFNYMP